MPQRDLYHQVVRNALEKAGWIIISDPMSLVIDSTYVYVDLEARFATHQNETLRAIEIKVVKPTRALDEIEKAIGQYIIYRGLLELHYPYHQCYLAIPQTAYEKHLSGSDFQYILSSNEIHLLIFDQVQEEVIQWINWNVTNN
jgi:hypothetical protein